MISFQLKSRKGRVREAGTDDTAGIFLAIRWAHCGTVGFHMRIGVIYEAPGLDLARP